jgi:hypothetical protein
MDLHPAGIPKVVCTGGQAVRYLCGATVGRAENKFNKVSAEYVSARLSGFLISETIA